jgi:hypothetical protein
MSRGAAAVLICHPIYFPLHAMVEVNKKEKNGQRYIGTTMVRMTNLKMRLGHAIAYGNGAHPHPCRAQPNMTHCPVVKWGHLGTNGKKTCPLKKTITPPTHPDIIPPTTPKPSIDNKSKSTHHHHPTPPDSTLTHARAQSNGSTLASALMLPTRSCRIHQ